MPFDVALTFVLMAAGTYLTRISGYLVLSRMKLTARAERVLQAVPGCVLISVLTPHFFSGSLADTAAMLITVIAAWRLPMLPAVLIAIAAAGILRAVSG